MAVLFAVLIQLKIILIHGLLLIFPDQTIMTQSGNGTACESDVTSLGTGQGLNFDEDSKILAISCISPSSVKDIFTKLITDDLPISIGFSRLLCDVMYKPTDTILSQS